MSKPAAEHLVEVYEDRIVRLEDKISHASSKIDVIDTKLDGLCERIDLSFQNLNEKLLAHAQEDAETAAKILPIVEKVSAVDKRLAEIEQTATRRKARWNSVIKGFWAIIIAGGGVGVKELVTFLFKHL